MISNKIIYFFIILFLLFLFTYKNKEHFNKCVTVNYLDIAHECPDKLYYVCDAAKTGSIKSGEKPVLGKDFNISCVGNLGYNIEYVTDVYQKGGKFEKGKDFTSFNFEDIS